MANSNMAKYVLAQALKEMLEEMPFEKIRIAQLCEKCNMSRKNFYYYFKDKYDLVNWIFDTEFLPIANARNPESSYQERKEFLLIPCCYFYENRTFYRKVLKLKGQNSFSEHLREYFQPELKTRISSLCNHCEIDDFTADFFTDAAMCAIERWLLDKDCMPPQDFVGKLMQIIEMSAATICKEID